MATTTILSMLDHSSLVQFEMTEKLQEFERARTEDEGRLDGSVSTFIGNDPHVANLWDEYVVLREEHDCCMEWLQTKAG